MTFDIANIFGPDPVDDLFTLAWDMTCANDVILATVDTPHQSIDPTPPPATLPLFASGAGLVGWLCYRRKKSAAATGRSK